MTRRKARRAERPRPERCTRCCRTRPARFGRVSVERPWSQRRACPRWRPATSMLCARGLAGAPNAPTRGSTFVGACPHAYADAPPACAAPSRRVRGPGQLAGVCLMGGSIRFARSAALARGGTSGAHRPRSRACTGVGCGERRWTRSKSPANARRACWMRAVCGELVWRTWARGVAQGGLARTDPGLAHAGLVRPI
jgi:hypothetical protein